MTLPAHSPFLQSHHHASLANMNLPNIQPALLCAVAALSLAACGGGGDDGASIGGTVNGLASGLAITLQNNGADNFSISGNDSKSFTFDFATTVPAGGGYNVSVLAQPLGQTCAVVNGSGNVDGGADPVTSVIVNCTTTSSVTGTVSGLKTGVAVTLGSNGVQTLLGNGAFALAGVLPTGSTYSVTIVAQPLGQTCTLANATGIVEANKPASVAVNCI
jgi:hypothetical protein